MIKSNEHIKSPICRAFEFLLLIVTLCVLAIRATYPESPNTNSIMSDQVLSNAAFSLIITSVLVFCFAAWIFFAFLNSKVRYRFSWIEVCTFVFIAAGIAAVFVASNKRFAITELVTIAGPMLAAIMLVQILDSDFKIKLVLMTIVACGVVSTYKSSEDFFSYNQMIIDQYEENPTAQLDQLGIEEGTFQHFSYEHRLYSKDVRGFMTTGNSVGSFMIMAIFASMTLFWKKISKSPPAFLIAVALMAIVCFGLALTHSKGGIAAIIVSMSMLGVYLFFGKLLKRFRVPIIIVCVLAAALLTAVTIKYGMEHGRLPGGNSMLVRWQYWEGAIKTYALKPFTGVGGGNFASYYTQFKEPGALETVKDPHNFLLSILSQYGPFALLGLCGAFILPMTRLVFSRPVDDCVIAKSPYPSKKAFAVMTCIIAAMLVFRPILMKVNFGPSSPAMIFASIYLFVMPALIFFIAALLMIVREGKLQDKLNGKLDDTQLSEKTGAILFCAIAAVALHNLVDFAFFEPGVSTIFWTLVACMVAWQLNKNQPTAAIFKTNKTSRITGACFIFAAFCAFVHFAVTGPVRASLLQSEAIGNYYLVHEKLTAAAQADLLSSEAVNLHGNVLLRQFDDTDSGRRSPDILHQAIDRFTEAKKRDSVNYSYYEKLSKTHDLLASVTTVTAAKANKEKAAFWMDEAIKRYPNSARLHIEAGKLAESINNYSDALKHYKKAVEIEDKYREVFKVMYPGREIFSRLGEDKYQFAKNKINQFKI